MIIATNLIFLFTTIFTKAYKKWQDYYKTVLFVSFCNLLYNLLCHDHLTWRYRPDFLLNHTTTDLINTFVLLPATTVLYLHFFPRTRGKQLLYYLGWIVTFSALEYIWYVFGRITYSNGWNFYWSMGFYFTMFYTLITHHRQIKKALLISLMTIVFLILFFKIPIGT